MASLNINVPVQIKKENVGRVIVVENDMRSKLIYYLECCSDVLKQAGVTFDLTQMRLAPTPSLAGAVRTLFDIETMCRLGLFKRDDNLKGSAKEFIRETPTIDSQIQINGQLLKINKEFQPTKVNYVTKYWYEAYYVHPLKEALKQPIQQYDQILMFKKMKILDDPKFGWAKQQEQLSKEADIRANAKYLAKMKVDAEAKMKADIEVEAKMKADIEAKMRADNANACCVCMDKPKDTICLPCGHLSYCGDCSRQLTKCAMCNRNVESWQRVYQ
jgi:hypothetical protein